MDKELESAIDNAGRDRVFAFMRANGWTPYSAPPKWVWWAAVSAVQELSQ